MSAQCRYPHDMICLVLYTVAVRARPATAHCSQRRSTAAILPPVRMAVGDERRSLCSWLLRPNAQRPHSPYRSGSGGLHGWAAVCLCIAVQSVASSACESESSSVSTRCESSPLCSSACCTHTLALRHQSGIRSGGGGCAARQPRRPWQRRAVLLLPRRPPREAPRLPCAPPPAARRARLGRAWTDPLAPRDAQVPALQQMMRHSIPMWWRLGTARQRCLRLSTASTLPSLGTG